MPCEVYVWAKKDYPDPCTKWPFCQLPFGQCIKHFCRRNVRLLICCQHTIFSFWTGIMQIFSLFKYRLLFDLIRLLSFHRWTCVCVLFIFMCVVSWLFCHVQFVARPPLSDSACVCQLILFTRWYAPSACAVQLWLKYNGSKEGWQQEWSRQKQGVWAEWEKGEGGVPEQQGGEGESCPANPFHPWLWYLCQPHWHRRRHKWRARPMLQPGPKPMQKHFKILISQLAGDLLGSWAAGEVIYWGSSIFTNENISQCSKYTIREGLKIFSHRIHLLWFIPPWALRGSECYHWTQAWEPSSW